MGQATSYVPHYGNIVGTLTFFYRTTEKKKGKENLKHRYLGASKLNMNSNVLMDTKLSALARYPRIKSVNTVQIL